MTRARLATWSEGIVLGTLGTALLHTVVSGQVKTLLHPLLQPLVAGGGIVLLLAAALQWIFASGPAPGLGGFSFCRRLARDLFAAAAVIAAVACAPNSFSSLALANRVTADPAAVLKNRPAEEAPAWVTDAGGAIKLETVDLLMAAEHPETIKELEGRKVRFIGQYVPGGDGFKITRFLMFCCAADAQPISIGVRTAPGAEPPALDKMAWAEVAGTVHFQEEVPGRSAPRVTAEEIKPIPEPANKFLY